jgi:hypothetical protein
VDGTEVTKFGPGTKFAPGVLTTQTLNGVRNKLYCSLFLRFTIAVPGDYEFVITPTNNKALTAIVTDHGKGTKIDSAVLGDVLKQTISLQTGDYVMEVYAQDIVAGSWATTSTPPSR